MSEARRLKSRAGCLQCKRRKVKCDQSLPSCHQCCRQKLPCPGYQKPLKWKDTPEFLNPTTLNSLKKPSSKAIARHGSRISISSPHQPSFQTHVPSPIYEISNSLINHYFTRVCRIAGCFDSPLSPFRTIPATMMAYSEPVFLLLQASSAAQLSRQKSEMRIKALTLQSEAFSAVRKDIGHVQRRKGEGLVSDELMLSSIIAGLTSAWYDVNDIGLSHVLGSQVLLSLWLGSKRNRLSHQENFILGAFVYWICITSFVVGDPEGGLEFQQGLLAHVRSLEMGHNTVEDAGSFKSDPGILPHPLTGFSTELFICVGKVGSLCRLRQNGNLMSDERLQLLEATARTIELELLDLQQSFQTNFTDPQDPSTTVEEILSVGEAYRCAGLLQLHTTFPQLLQHYYQKPPATDSMEEFTPWQHNWLRSLAVHILKILESIPPTSGTRVLQGLPAIIAASWLVDPMSSTYPSLPGIQHPRLPLTKSSASKEHWRGAVRSGLQMHEQYVGLQQVSRILHIVEEVWRLDDRGEGKCHWMVVVASKGLQTLYG